ncbi:hypothetical protein ACU4GR_10290 (plasmid) [Methylobacterium oryzae CBMB20]
MLPRRDLYPGYDVLTKRDSPPGTPRPARFWTSGWRSAPRRAASSTKPSGRR